MSRSIDHRIVEMQFKNRQFESGIKESLGSLAQLKKGLQLDGATRGLAELERLSGRFSLAGIADGVDQIASRFSLLGMIGVTALVNITNAAIETGMALIKSLSTDNIIAGFTKYEQKTEAVQTILAATGSELEDVNEQLNRLLWFTDETSYRFADMVRNIGRFTSAGIELNTSVTAMQGVATWAALSGQNVNEAGRAMDVMSNAISQGNMQLLQWRSIENANMATKEFKETLIATAVVMGALDKNAKTVDGTLVDIASFPTTLHQKWLTSDVLLVALDQYGKYADEVYKVATERGISAAQAMELVSNESMELGEKAFKASQQAKTFTESLEAVREAVSTGWMRSAEHIFGDYHEAVELWTDVTDGLWDIFVIGAERRNDMLQEWKSLGGRDDLIDAFWNVWEIVENIRGAIIEAFREFFPAMTGKRLHAITEGLKAFTERIQIGDETLDKLKRTFKGLFAFLDIVKDIFSAIGRGIGTILGALTGGKGDGLLSFLANMGDRLVALNEAFKSSEILDKGLEKLAVGMEWISVRIAAGIKLITDALQAIKDTDLSGLDSFMERIKARFDSLKEIFKFEKKEGVFTKFLDILKGIFPVFFKLASMVAEAFRKTQQKILEALDNADFDNIFDIINSVFSAGVLYGIWRFISSVKDITVGIADILDGVRGSLQAYQNTLNAKALVTIAIAIAILAAALVALSLIDSAKLTASLVAIGVLFTQLLGAMAIFHKVTLGPGGFLAMFKISSAMIAISVAVLILAFALAKIAKIDPEGIIKGLIAITVLSGIMVATALLLSANAGATISGALGFILFATSLLIMAAAVKRLGELDIDVLTRGLLALGVLLLQAVIFLKLATFSGLGITAGIGLLALAAAILVLSIAVRKLSEIDPIKLINGLIALGVVLAQVALFLQFSGNATHVISTAIGLTILGAAMLIFASAVEKFGAMPVDQLIKGLLGMAGALAAVVIAINFMPPGMIVKAAGLLIIAGALVVLSFAMKKMGTMSWEEIAKGLIALGGALAIIAVALTFMTTALAGAAALLVVTGALTILAGVLKVLGSMSLAQIGKALLALVGTFVVLGLAALVMTPVIPSLIGLGAALFIFGLATLAAGAGLLLFSTALAALAVSGVAGATALAVILTTIAGLVPVFFEQIAKGIISIAKVIGEGAPVITAAVKSVMLSFIGMVNEIAPEIMACLTNLLVSFLEVLATGVPKMVDAGMRLIKGVLEGVAAHIQDIVEAGIEIILGFMRGINSKVPDIIDLAFEIIITFINGLADAIRKNDDAMYDACANLIDAFVGSIVKFDSKLKAAGKQVVAGFVQGIRNDISDASSAAVALGNSVLSSVKNTFGIDSPSKVFKQYGIDISDGLIAGIKDSIPKVTGAATKMVDEVSKESSKAAKTASKKAFDAAVEAINERKYYNQLSIREEIAAWEELQKKYKANSEERKKIDREVYRARNELIKQEFEQSRNWMEERKYYNELSLKAELAGWERVQSRYLAGTVERKQADREVYRLRNELVKAEFNNSLRWIDERKYYNELSLKEELAAWERVQKRYLAGTEERKRADREVYRVKKDILDKIRQAEKDYYSKSADINKKLRDDIKSVNDAYDDALKSRTRTLYNAYGLFDKVQEREKVSGFELIKNLQNQVEEFTRWQYNLSILAGKGVDQGLIEELQELGPRSLAEIEALNTLSAGELNRYVDLWRTKYHAARSQAERELIGLRADSDRQIQALRNDAANELRKVQQVYISELKALATVTNEKLEEVNEIWETKLEELKNLATEDFEELTEIIETIMKKPDWKGLGSDIIEGIAGGVTDSTKILVMAVQAAALQALAAAKRILGIKSPSKEFARLGMYANQGFAEGFMRFSGLVASSASDVGNVALSALRDSISRISDILEGDIGLQPTIRPVLDMEDMKDQLKSTFDEVQAVDISASRNKAAAVRTSRQDDNDRTLNQTDNVDNSRVSIVNHYHVRDDNDIRKISRAQKNLFDRYNLARGVVV